MWASVCTGRAGLGERPRVGARDIDPADQSAASEVVHHDDVANVEGKRARGCAVQVLSLIHI